MRQVILLILFLMLADNAFARDPQTQPAAGLDRPWRQEIVYVVIVEKFFDGDPSNNIMARRFWAKREQYEGGFWGGDLAGVIQKLPYLQDLGVTAILLYPVMANDREPILKYLAPGYRPRDYFQVDENFGDMATLKKLVADAHRRGIKVLLDLPIGLPGHENPLLRDPAKKDWLGKPTAWGQKQWNAENPAVADYLIKVCKFWQEQSGCDGFRMDSAHLHPAAFWKRCAEELRARNKSFILWAEMPVRPEEIQSFLTASTFDTAYDFSAGIAHDVFAKGESVGKLSFVLGAGKKVYAGGQSLCVQIDNYEDPPFITAAKEPKLERMKLVMTYLLTIDRVPLIYPGDEAALAFRWPGELFDKNVQARPIVQYVRKLAALRRSEPALQDGDFTELKAKDPIYAFARSAGDSRVVVVLNNSDQPQDVRFPAAGTAWKDARLHDLISNKNIKAAGSDAPLAVGSWAALVLKVLK